MNITANFDMTIKYYDNLHYSNKNFSTFVPNWRTDMNSKLLSKENEFLDVESSLQTNIMETVYIKSEQTDEVEEVDCPIVADTPDYFKIENTQIDFSCPAENCFTSENTGTEENVKIIDVNNILPDAEKDVQLSFDTTSHQLVYKNKIYFCTFCNKNYTYSSFSNHKHTTNGEKPFKCTYCEKSFFSNWDLVIHTRIHTGEKPFRCEHCGKGFFDKSRLVTHVRIHSGDRPYRCTFCGKGFTNSSCLKRHIRTHTLEKPYVCELCKRSFCTSGQLKDHRRTHNTEKTFKCNVCKEVFGDKSTLLKHNKTHLDKPFVCEICNKSFTTRSNINKHKLTHSSVRPFGCDKCKKSFVTNGERLSHFLSHTDEKAFKCLVCEKRFKRRNALNEHKKLHQRSTSSNAIVKQEPENQIE